MSEQGTEGEDFEWADLPFLVIRMERCFVTLRCGLRQELKRRPEAFSSEVRQIIEDLFKLP